MKFDVQKTLLIENLSLVERVSGKHTTLPALQGVLLEAKDSFLTFRATNIDVGIETKVPSKILTPGSCLVPASVFLKVLSSYERGNSIFVETIDGVLILKSDAGVTKIKTLDKSEFPKLPSPSQDPSTTLKAKDLVLGIRSVWYAASQSTIKPELASVFLYPEGGGLVFVATDSFRLAEKRIMLEKPITFEPILLPVRNLPEIVRVLESCDGHVVMSASPNQLSLSHEGVYITSRLIEGSFPDYKQIIPKSFETTAVLLRDDLHHVLKKSFIFSDRFNQIQISINPKENSFSVHAENTHIGQMDDVIESTISGEPLTMSFNQKYLFDCFQSITSESVTLSFSGVGRPMVCKGSSDDSFFYLVMPMNK